tara:strand:- start:21 stop:239 length:219 start_codon:yes stop_codon:yes gene_type:complete
MANKPENILATIEIEYRFKVPANVVDVDVFVKKKAMQSLGKDIVTLQKYNTYATTFMEDRVARVRVEEDIDD